MTWSAFKTIVDELLAVERRRLGVQPFIDRTIRLGVGHVQNLIEYYRRGIVTVLDHDDAIPDGHASKVRMPAGAMIRAVFYVGTGSRVTSRPLYPVDWSNSRELRAGVVAFPNLHRYSIDPRDGARNALVYPPILKGNSVRVEWDVLVGRESSYQYADADEVPFDEPMAQVIYHYVKSRLALEVDGNIALKREHDGEMRIAINRLYVEVEERIRKKLAESERVAANGCQATGLVSNHPGNACGTIDPETLTKPCAEKVMPALEWVMFGDSGDPSNLDDTVKVAAAVQAVNPDFVFHLGDAAYPDGARPIVRDLFTKHYWNFLQGERMYLAPGNHDLYAAYETSAVLEVFPNVRRLIGDARIAAKQLWYDFALGDVRFFVVNSGTADDDANIQITAARQWLAERTCACKEQWFVLVHHRPDYTSDASHGPGSTLMRQLTPHLFGIDLVVSAHAHNYERVLDTNGLMHVICGLGGAPRRNKGSTVAGSQMFFSSQHGFLKFAAARETMQFEMVTVSGEVVDRVTLQKADEPRECAYAYAP